MSDASIAALGLDVGDRRIGVAGCDATGLIATGLATLTRKTLSEDISLLQSWIQKRQAQILVVGLPRRMDGTLGSQAKKVQRFVNAITQALPLPVDYVDEQLTTAQAEWEMQEQRIPLHRRKQLVDQFAARIILQEWLDQRRERLRHQGLAPAVNTGSIPTEDLGEDLTD